VSGLPGRAWACAVALAGAAAGCGEWKFDAGNPFRATPKPPAYAAKSVPEPIHLLLPTAIRIHPFTGTRTFDDSGGIKGVEVRVEALDAYGDATKAFGNFHFALHAYQPAAADERGKQIATWDESLLEPRKNLLHWDNITRTYRFKLQWYKPIPVGSKFVLAAAFDSPFTERKFAQRVFVSGQ